MKSRYKYFNKPSAKVDKKVDKLLKKLTLEEKINLLGGVEFGTRPVENKIPEIKFADGPVGIHWWCDKSTAYPALIALASSFDKKLAYRMGWALGRDCRARGVHVLLAPGVNIYRSALCGRNFEYLGEDPCLSSKMCAEYIKGVQDMGVSATVKHYALNNQEFDRNHTSSDADERTMREIYLPAFEAAVKEAGAGALMTGYNLVNGQHCSENDFLVNGILKGEWGFEGVVMSDWVSVYDAVGAANAGLDLEMPFPVHFTVEKLLSAINQGLVTKKMIDDKVRRILRLAVCFGWFDRPQKDDSIPMDDPETAAVALEIARRGSVLLKNSKGMLPLKKKKIKKLAVLGYHAGHPVICGGGSAYTPPNRVTTLLDGIRKEAGPDCEVVYEKAIDLKIFETAFTGIKYTAPDGSEGVLMEYFNGTELSGKPAASVVDPRINYSWGNKTPHPEVDKNQYAVRCSGKISFPKKDKYKFFLRATDGTAKVFIDGKLFYDNSVKQDGMQYWVAEMPTGECDLRIEYVKTRGWNRLSFGFIRDASIIEDYQRACKAAKAADAVILTAGFENETEGEGFDRPFEITKSQIELINEIASINPNIAVVVYAGGNIEMKSWINKVKGLLYVWYPGQEGGAAAAEILFGKVNPSGKLPATFEKRIEDRSSFDCYHDSDKDKRIHYADGIFCGYRHFDRNRIKPLFPFGHGLSYTKFKYSKLKMSAKKMSNKGNLKISFCIDNTGSMDGAETAMIFISDLKSEHVRPVKELKGFVKLDIKAGKSKTAEWTIDADALKYFHPDRKEWVVEPGEFKVMIGSSAEDIHLSAKFTVG